MATANPSCLYDISWTIHRIPSKLQCNSTYRNLLTDQAAIDALARNLKSFLEENRRKAQEYDDSDSDRTGGLQTVSIDRLEDEDSYDASCVEGLFIALSYERAAYKAAFCRRRVNSQYNFRDDSNSVELPLGLIRMPNHLSKRVCQFLYDTFHIAPEPFKLSASFLYEVFIDFINTIASVKNVTARSDLLSTVVKDMKYSYGFGPPVAPQLKTMDMSISLDAIIGVINARSSEDQQHQKSTGTMLIDLFADHLVKQTGLQLPGPGISTDQQMIKVSKIGCAAFVISADGKIKLISKVLDGVVGAECIPAAEQANAGLLEALVGEASESD